MPRISNREVRSYVDRREEFVTNNGTIISDTTFSGDIDDATALPSDKGKGFYIVYSYGKHFPMLPMMRQQPNGSAMAASIAIQRRATRATLDRQPTTYSG